MSIYGHAPYALTQFLPAISQSNSARHAFLPVVRQRVFIFVTFSSSLSPNDYTFTDDFGHYEYTYAATSIDTSTANSIVHFNIGRGNIRIAIIVVLSNEFSSCVTIRLRINCYPQLQKRTSPVLWNSHQWMLSCCKLFVSIIFYFYYVSS
jgi:hypothetical protein